MRKPASAKQKIEIPDNWDSSTLTLSPETVEECSLQVTCSEVARSPRHARASAQASSTQDEISRPPMTWSHEKLSASPSCLSPHPGLPLCKEVGGLQALIAAPRLVSRRQGMTGPFRGRWQGLRRSPQVQTPAVLASS